MYRFDSISSAPAARPGTGIGFALKYAFLPRIFVLLAASIAIMLVVQLVRSDPIDPLIATSAIFVLVASATVATFYRDFGNMLLWVLLVEAALPIYQIALYLSYDPDPIFFKMLPVFIGIVLLHFSGLRYSREQSFEYILWILCNIPAYISASIDPRFEMEDVSVLLFINVYYPIVLHYVASQARVMGMDNDRMRDVMVIAVLAQCAVPLLLMPLELRFRDSDSLASLQFGGRSYAVIGLILLVWPLILDAVPKWRIWFQVVAYGLIFATFIISFSRGALAVAGLLLIGSVIFADKKQRLRMIGAVFIFILLGGILVLLSPDLYDSISTFWLLRLNMASNVSSGLVFDLDLATESGRGDIWRDALTFFWMAPIMGHGIGATPALINEATWGAASFSGMHNQALTVMVERGLIGFMGYAALIVRIIYLILTRVRAVVERRRYLFSFSIFLIFANTTGVELFLNGSTLMNASVVAFLFLMVAYLEGYADQRSAV